MSSKSSTALVYDPFQALIVSLFLLLNFDSLCVLHR
jgi:hypothetical protein